MSRFMPIGGIYRGGGISIIVKIIISPFNSPLPKGDFFVVLPYWKEGNCKAVEDFYVQYLKIPSPSDSPFCKGAQILSLDKGDMEKSRGFVVCFTRYSEGVKRPKNLFVSCFSGFFAIAQNDNFDVNNLPKFFIFVSKQLIFLHQYL